MAIDAKKKHSYRASLRWTGADARGTTGYAAYSRDHEITGEGKTESIAGSSDPHFRGNPARYNAEELLVASLSACHMLWYLHLCAVNHVVVVDYEDDATGTMIETHDGSGEFSEVTLRPKVTIAAGSDRARALELHHDAAKLCFIARSVRFAVNCEPGILISSNSG